MVPARFHRAFNDRDFDALHEVFTEDVELVVDGMAVQGIDAAVEYLIMSVRHIPGLHIASERVVAESDDTAVTEIGLVDDDPAGGHARQQGTACEIWRVRGGRAVSVRSYYMPEPADRADPVRVLTRGEAAVVSEDHAALQRVATLVARGITQDELFAAVTQEVGRLVAADTTALLRFESDDTITLVAAWSGQTTDLPIGSSTPVDEVLLAMRETGRPWRSGPMTPPLSGSFVDLARTLGLRAFVGVPIAVDGRVWGVAFAASAADRPFADGAEARLAGFTELVAIAIANAQARMELRGFADEQAALRRVATLVARAAPPQEVFAAVTAEVGLLLQVDIACLGRYEPDGTPTLVGAWAKNGIAPPAPIGFQWTLTGQNLVSRVYRTGRPARVDDYDVPGISLGIAHKWGIHASVGVPIAVEDRLWGVMMVAASDPQPPIPSDTEARLAGFTELVATTLANAEAQAALAASRARIVTAADAARRRIERDLHDGAQQRLVSLGLQLRAAQAEVPPGADELTEQLDRVVEGLTGVLDELREIARGLHPAALAEGGLRPALRALARRSAVPVRLDVGIDGRLSDPVELAAYYVVAESLTNAAKHSRATVVDVEVWADEGTLHVVVRDDGRGGANATNGTGLAGLEDRVEALGGQLALYSPPGLGTALHVSLPLGPLVPPLSAAGDNGR